MKEVYIVFTDQDGPIANEVLGLRWTHVLIQFGNGLYYEATWPKVCTSKGFKHTDHIRVKLVVSEQSYRAMQKYANKRLGVRYNFLGYFFPNLYGRTKGVYCSQFVCNVLRAGGIQIPKLAGYSPDTLLQEINTCQKR